MVVSYYVQRPREGSVGCADGTSVWGCSISRPGPKRQSWAELPSNMQPWHMPNEFFLLQLHDLMLSWPKTHVLHSLQDRPGVPVSVLQARRSPPSQVYKWRPGKRHREWWTVIEHRRTQIARTRLMRQLKCDYALYVQTHVCTESGVLQSVAITPSHHTEFVLLLMDLPLSALVHCCLLRGNPGPKYGFSVSQQLPQGALVNVFVPS